MSIDVKKIKQDFPVLQREINGKELVYLDSANTSQKPESVMSSMRTITVILMQMFIGVLTSWLTKQRRY